MAVNADNQDVIVVSSNESSKSSVSFVQTTPVKNLIQISSSPQQGFVGKKVPVQLRVVQAIPKPNILIQPQIYRIVKNEPMATTSASSIANLKFSNIPIQGTAPSTSMSASQVQPGINLKVSDMVTLPKFTLPIVKEESATSSRMTSSFPAKVIRVTQPSSSHGAESTGQTVWPKSMSSPGLLAHAEATQTDHMPVITSTWSKSSLRSPSKRPSSLTSTEATMPPDNKRRRVGIAEKSRKGLRHFAMLVCEKVKEKVTTTYNEVADELVTEYAETQAQFPDQQYDQKNIRRRVYDALNVLMAMEIIQKDKKEIHWLGLPTNSAQELQALHDERKTLKERIKHKTSELHELILQQIVFKNLVQRNKRIEEARGTAPQESSIQLPFIIVNTSKKTMIDCSISWDKYEYVFNFDNTFEIHDDVEVLKRMGMAYGLETGQCAEGDLKTAQSLLPPALKPYIEKMASPFFTKENFTNSFLASNSQKDRSSCSSDSGRSNHQSRPDMKQEWLNNEQPGVSMEEIFGIGGS